ncbi:MAG: hypothetical protein JEZ00_18690 [Anaerolineaceae bacterium]|nr:hypothetical protein [Anaerolineaceae bacterium]
MSIVTTDMKGHQALRKLRIFLQFDLEKYAIDYLLIQPYKAPSMLGMRLFHL